MERYTRYTSYTTVSGHTVTLWLELNGAGDHNGRYVLTVRQSINGIMTTMQEDSFYTESNAVFHYNSWVRKYK